MTAKEDQSEVCATHACFNIDIHIYDTLGFQVRKESRRKKRRIHLKTTGRGFNRNVKHEKT